jgi:hypothetical protein
MERLYDHKHSLLAFGFLERLKKIGPRVEPPTKSHRPNIMIPFSV